MVNGGWWMGTGEQGPVDGDRGMGTGGWGPGNSKRN